MSALNARMRAIAREEAQIIFLDPEQTEQWKAREAALTGERPDRAAELEKQVTELQARVDALEKATVPTPARKAAARKATPESTE